MQLKGLIDNPYLRLIGFILIILYLTTVLNQIKYYDQLTSSRKYHYQDVAYILEATNKECLKRAPERVCLEEFVDVVKSYNNKGTVSLFDSSGKLIFQKKDEAIYDHRVPVTVRHTFSEFKSTQPTLEISKLTSYPSVLTNSLNAMTFSSWNYLQDFAAQILGKEPHIKDMSRMEFAKKVAWERFYPAIPFLAIILVVLFHGVWRRRKTEKLNLQLVKEQQQLNKEKDELTNSIEFLSTELESKDFDAELLAKRIDDLEIKIKDSVDKQEIDALLDEKANLEKELKVNQEEKDRLSDLLDQKDEDQQMLQDRIEEYELKSGYTLVGEFVRSWTAFEKQLRRLTSNDSSSGIKQSYKGKDSTVNAVQLIDDIYNQALINQQQYNDLFNVRKFRNSLMHGSATKDEIDYDHITSELKTNIQILEQVTKKLEVQEVYN